MRTSLPLSILREARSVSLDSFLLRGFLTVMGNRRFTVFGRFVGFKGEWGGGGECEAVILGCNGGFVLRSDGGVRCE